MSQALGDEQERGSLRVAEFDYDLPPQLIAQEPLPDRDRSRMLVLDRQSGERFHSSIDRLAEWLTPGDLLVANNSRVIPARLHGVRLPGRGALEVLLLRQEGGVWTALARPASRLKPGTELRFNSQDPNRDVARAIVTDNVGAGEIRLHFPDGDDQHLEAYGVAPIPPYITEPLHDAERYQTVYASVPGSAAAPTAGLHFSPALLETLATAGLLWAEVTLHVGLDTFRPVTAELVNDHKIHSEWCVVSDAAAARIAEVRSRGGRVVAIGTTAARTLETLGKTWRQEDPRGFQGYTDTFIVPGYRWQLVDALLTNFHLPRSTLLMMVSALAGRDRILASYEEAIEREYRFFSFGDAMLIR